MHRARPSARALPAALLLAAPLLAPAAGADVPYPTCADRACADPAVFGDYLFLDPGDVPDDYTPVWKYEPGSGLDVVGAWEVTTGRPDVVVAVLDSGIRWDEPEVARKVALNAAELPLPPGCAFQDCNGDGFVSVDDYPATPDHNANGLLDGQDLILEFSDGIDDDGNGFVDDIAGWDFSDDDNDPDDVVDFGHGTGEAEDSTGEANNGVGSLPGVAPSALFLPLRVADSFVAIGSDFARAVVYAVDREADVVQEALGTVSASPTSQAAIDYAYRRGIPVIASAADEESRHHNFPAVLEHTIWVNSIVHGDGTIVEQEDVFDLLNGCTNHGGRAWVAISSNSCSSEATGRAAGLAVLLVSHGKNLVDAGLLSNHPGLDRPFSAEEIRQIFRQSAEDIDHSGDLMDLSINPGVQLLLSAIPDFILESLRFPTQAGWDSFTGYGRPNGPALLDVTADTIPPEADLSGGLPWFATVDPVATPLVDVRGSAAAVRSGADYDWALEVGCGVQPGAWTPIDAGSASGPLDRAVLGTWDAAATHAACGFAGAPIEDPDDRTATLRLRVTDVHGNVGEDRRTLALHTDPTLAHAVPLGTSAEGSPALADVNRDGVLDLVFGTADGRLHVRRGDGGATLSGFPARTAAIPVHPSPGYASGEVPVPHEAILAPTAADDLDGDGRVEIVVASAEGGVYVFDDHGGVRPGFPVRTDPVFSATARKDALNDLDPGIVAGPTLVDLDAPGVDPTLEIVAAALDGHLYAWRADASPVAGFPVRIADRAKVAVDPATGKTSPLVPDDPDVRDRAAKIIGSPAAGDLDGDGRNEILVTSNEEYANEPDSFATESAIVSVLSRVAQQLGEDFSFDTTGRLYAVHAEGSLHPSGPFLAGWPVRVPILAPGVLPTVGTGVPGSPALAALPPPAVPAGAVANDGPATLTAAIFGVVGPAMLFEADGSPSLGLLSPPGGGPAAPRALPPDFPPPGFPNNLPATAGSFDSPFFAALGSGAFGDITGDGRPEYVAPGSGLRKLIDVLAAARQAPGDHLLMAWDPVAGTLLPAFPRPMDDMQFLTSPSLADVDGDGVAEIVQGSGAYLVRAYRADGSTPPDFPKFTNHWLFASPTAGDVDGDGRIEIVALTREGTLWIWDTPAPATAAAIPWQGFGGDRRNTQNLASGVSPLAPAADPLEALAWAIEAIRLDVIARRADAPGPERGALRASAIRKLLRWALQALAEHRPGRLPGILPELGDQLADPALGGLGDGLLERLADATADAAQASVACPGGLGACPSLRRAERLMGHGLRGLALGDTGRGLRLLARAIEDAHAGPGAP